MASNEQIYAAVLAIKDDVGQLKGSLKSLSEQVARNEREDTEAHRVFEDHLTDVLAHGTGVMQVVKNNTVSWLSLAIALAAALGTIWGALHHG